MSLSLLVITTFILSFAAIKFFTPLAVNIGLVDIPNERKLHIGHVPLVGGIAIFLAVLVASYLFLPNTIELRMYLIASAMIVFIGALDDKYDLSVHVKLVGQIIVASILIYGINGYISNFGNLFGFGDITIGAWGIVFSYFAIIVIINAFNLVDGIDGLAGCLSINTFISIAILFLITNQRNYFVYPLIIIAAILPYLMFNLGLYRKTVQKIFMGDAGSMFIGLSIIWLLTLGTQGESASFRPVTALWICAMPLMDMLAIFVRRVKKGKSPFKPDRDHLHHILQRAGLSQAKTLFTIVLLSVLMSSIGFAGEYFYFAEVLMLVSFLIIFVLYNLLIQKLVK
ncbi:UDP-N-acetylglucosamine--undecaprenyl-phosphate N-acetylglucosaminephosphotransferase [Thalassotalea nanhaiensis]|uniref:Undecaprenyl-phosphate alpha-N-acetylglucosaminyl 1-phosphate transferase n=1 Tax=Thalassotalea nanhaiensis TaxID=3065648 RepID=A0ABY9TLJ8_9GAMM|nr:UDP-N-acetylglucosamine--undecaprenyl-phosphate N-acetylglucosaminephosphotransferase [Colwelliaceae bacterium SQ345]